MSRGNRACRTSTLYEDPREDVGRVVRVDEDVAEMPYEDATRTLQLPWNSSVTKSNHEVSEGNDEV